MNPSLLPVCCLQGAGLVPGSWTWGRGRWGCPHTEVWRQPQRECPGTCSDIDKADGPEGQQ